jgi:two-component system sensor histidine kinase UhpB
MDLKIFGWLAPMATHERGVDLKRHLLLRVTLFAVVICLFAVGAVLQQARGRIRAHIEQTGSTVERLIAGEAIQPRGDFEIGLNGLGLGLGSLESIGDLLGICVQVEDIYDRPIVERCFGEAAGSPVMLREALGFLVGKDTLFRGIITQYPGYKVGRFVVTPNLDSEALAVWREVRTVLGMTIGILALNLFIYLPVRRALQPTERILAVLECMEAGDLAARMPRPRLIELNRIAAGFDHLTDRLRKTMADQRLLAQRLLAVREEERRYLARELHDEFGQCLASISVDAGFVTARLQNLQPELLPAIQSISSVTAGMMESLQGILGQLRPQGLEEFGLRAGLEQLVGGWQRRLPECGIELLIDGEIDDLPDELTVSLYRIAQESLTNALRHSVPRRLTVSLERTGMQCRLCVEDDGEARAPGSAGSGLGVLGMNERVVALGGRFAITALTPRGTRVLAEFPAEALGATGSDHG